MYLRCLAVLACAAPSALPAQDAQGLKQEAAFLRGLAKDWGFVDLAQARLSEMRQELAGNDEALRRLAHIHAEVLYLGARRIRDLDKRKGVLAEALQKFDDYLSQFSREEGATEVLASQAEACEYYGRFLSDAIQVERDPDKKKSLEEEALNVFQSGIKACNSAMQQLEATKNKNSKSKAAFYLSWMRKGTLLREWAKTVEKDREVKSMEAIQELESMVIEVGEETAIGVKGLLEMGVAMDVQGQTADALDTYQGTVELCLERIKDTRNPIGLSSQALLFRFLEEAYRYLTEVHVREGQLPEALAAVKAYKATRDDLEFPTNPMIADVVLLNGARALVDSGGKKNITDALEVAKAIAQRHAADFVGLRARGIINQVLSSSGIEVGADALMQAATGDLQSGKQQAAIRGFKRVLRSLSTQAEESKYGLSAYRQLGISFAVKSRYLEATYAFMEGLRRFGRTTEDPDLPGRVANDLGRATRLLKRQKNDTLYQRLADRADQVIVRFAGATEGDKIRFKKAGSLIEKHDFDAAVKELQTVAETTKEYEVAQTTIAFALWKKGDFAGARQVLDRYLRWIADPLHKPSGTDQEQRRQLRQMAQADAHFYRGMMLADEAFGRGNTPDGARRAAEPAKKKDVVQAFQNYAKDYGSIRRGYAVRATYELVKSLVDLERIGDAETEYAKLRKQFPDSSLLTNLAIVLFNAHGSTINAIEQEIKAIGNDPAKAKDARTAQARLRAEVLRTLTFANNYTAMERQPDYGLLRNSSKYAARIRNWDRAEFFLTKILAVHGKNKAFKGRLNNFVKPELAEIKMQKGDFRTALTYVNDSLKTRPNSYALKRLKIRALGGWCRFDESGQLRRPLGLSRFKDAYDLLFQDYGKYIKAKVKKYTLEWYSHQLACLDMSLKLMTKDSDYQRAALSFYRIAEGDEDFATLKKFGKPGLDLVVLFQRLRP